MRPTSFLLFVIVLIAATIGSAQTDAPKPVPLPAPDEVRFREIERELRENWEAMRRSVGNDFQGLRRIHREQGDRLIRTWRDYLARHADSPRAFEAKNYLLQGFIFADQKKAAASLLDEMERAAKTPTRAVMVATGHQYLQGDVKPAIAALERCIGRMKDRADKAATTLAMRRFAEGSPLECVARRLAISHRVLRDYPDTPSGRIAKKHVRAAGLRPGTAPIELDRYRDTKGRPLALAALRGRVVVLHFWVSHSATSRTSLGLLDRLMDGDDGPIVIAVSCDAVRADFERAIEPLRGSAWRHYFDGRSEGNRIAEDYAIENLPQSLVIGRDGRLFSTGQFGESALAVIKAALKRPVEKSER